MIRIVTVCLPLFLAAPLWGIDSRYLLKPEELPKPPSAKRGGTPVSVTSPPRPSPPPQAAAGLPEKRVALKSTSPSPPASPRRVRRVTTRPQTPEQRAGQHELRLSGAVAGARVDHVTPLLNVWPRIAGVGASRRSSPLSYSGDDFSISFDPARYPVLETVEGGKILLDTAGTLPPLIQSLVSSIDPSLRVVNDDPADRRRFLASVLSAGGFYSVEEGFRFSAGSDPLLTVEADFKVERKQESLLGQDVVLVNHNTSRSPYSSSLRSFMVSQGFSVVEPYADEYVRSSRQWAEPGRLHLVSGTGAASSVDRILDAIGVNYERNSRLPLFSASRDGVEMTVRVDRSFLLERTPCVVGFFRGDPVAYTLMRLLETRGYRVVMLQEKDSFRDVSRKIIDGLRLPGDYGFRRIPLPADSPFALSLTALHLQSRSGEGTSVILTERKLDPALIRIIEEAGYRVVD